MNKKASSYLWGLLLLIAGLIISLGGFYFKCVAPNPTDAISVTSCLVSLNTLLMVGIGMVVAFIGATIIYYSNPNQ